MQLRSLPGPHLDHFCDETVEAAWTKTISLGEAFGLIVYDAAYLELAFRRGLTLANLDEQLRSAMKKAGGRVPL